MAEMSWLDRMNRVLDAVEERLREGITDGEIAALALQGADSFRADFSRITGISLQEYIRRRRLSCAAWELMNTQISVTDAALSWGYQSPDAFSAAFRRLHGISPSTARKGGHKLSFFCRMQLQLTMMGVDRMEYTILHREGFRVVGVRKVTPFGGGTWGIIKSDGSQERMKAQLGCEMELGLCFGFGSDGSNDYMCAAEFAGRAEGWDTFEFPAATWLQLEAGGKISGNVLGVAWQRIHEEFLPQSHYELQDLPTIEKYTLWDEYKDECRVEIYLPVRLREEKV